MLIINKFNKIGCLLFLTLIWSLLLVACGDDTVAVAPTSTPTTAPIVAPTPTTRPTTTAAPTTTTLVITIAPATTRVTTTVVPSTTTAQAVNTTQAASGDAANGKKLFEEVGCSACHGALAQGAYGPKIAGTSLSYEQVLLQVRNPKGKGPNVMTPFASEEISDRGVADVYAYLQTLK